MKILVTGGTGFSGKALAKRLHEEGHEVIAMDYKDNIGTEDLKKLGVKLVFGSVTDERFLDEHMPGVEVVFHLAAAFRELNVSRSHYDEVNVGGTKILLQTAHRHGVAQFIYCSTCGVHGNIEHPPAGEDAPIAPADYYQQTKYNAEPLVLEYRKKGMKAVILRPAGIYGPGDPERFFMIFRRVAKGVFPMFGSGKTLYHSLYIDNLVDAFVLAMESSRCDGEAYLIADEEFVEIEDLVRRVAKAMNVDVRIPHFPVMPLVFAGHVCEKLCQPFGIAPPIFPRRVDWFRQNRAFKIDKARAELGYQPMVGLDEGLKRTYEWYREAGYLQ